MNGPAPRSDDGFAGRLSGRGPVGWLATLLVLAAGAVFGPLKAAPVLLWAWMSRTPWRDLGFVRPANWARTVAVSVVLGAAFKLAMKSVVMPLLGAEPVNPAFRFLAHNSAALPRMLFEILLGAAFGEEVLFRGFLFERWRRLFGGGRVARTAIVVLSAALFGAAHYSTQGLAGAQQAFLFGLVFGALYARTGRLIELMLAHAAFDLTAVALIYWGLETDVARWFFR